MIEFGNNRNWFVQIVLEYTLPGQKKVTIGLHQAKTKESWRYWNCVKIFSTYSIIKTAIFVEEMCLKTKS